MADHADSTSFVCLHYSRRLSLLPKRQLCEYQCRRIKETECSTRACTLNQRRAPCNTDMQDNMLNIDYDVLQNLGTVSLAHRIAVRIQLWQSSWNYRIWQQDERSCKVSNHYKHWSVLHHPSKSICKGASTVAIAKLFIFMPVILVPCWYYQLISSNSALERYKAVKLSTSVSAS